MPKRSIKEDKLKLMCGRRSIKKIKSPEKKKKPSNTAPKAPAAAAAAPKATASKPLNITLSDVSPEFKRLVVTELIKSGKARVIKAKKKDIMKK